MTEAIAPGLSTLHELESLSDAEPMDLSQQQLAEIRKLFNESLFWFAWFIFRYRDITPNLHGRLAHLAKLWGSPGYERLMVQIPRNHLKTSTFTIPNALWQICRDPDAPVCIISEKLDNVQMWVRTIRDMASASRMFQVVYKDLCPPGIALGDTRSMPRWWKWSESELMFHRSLIQPEASITAMGMGAASAGRHWPKIIKDDLISEDAANSPSVMATAIDWFDKSLYLERPALQGWDLIVCTPWSYDDVYCWGGESRVWMGDGSWKPIRDVEVGDVVVGFERSGLSTRPELIGKRGGRKSRTGLCFTRVLDRGSRPAGLVTHLLDDGSSFRCTESHRFFKIQHHDRPGGPSDEAGVGLADADYSEVRNLTRLRKVMDPFGECPDVHVAGWLGGMYDADGSYNDNRIIIYQSDKHYPEICNRIRDSFEILGIGYKEYTTTQDNTPRGVGTEPSVMKQFCVSDREGRSKFLAWCKPTKHRDRIKGSIVGWNPFHTARITGRSEPELAEVHWIQTETGNYICEGLASKNSHALRKYDYKLYRRAALENAEGEADITGEPIFPEMFSKEQLLAQYRRDEYGFSSQLMCNPRPGREVSFDQTWDRFGSINYSDPDRPFFTIRRDHYDPAIRDEALGDTDTPPRSVAIAAMQKVVLLDPAPSEERDIRSDRKARNAFVIEGKDAWGRRYLLETVAVRVDPYDVILEAFRLLDKWGTDTLAVEEVVFSKLYRHWVNREAQLRGIAVRVLRLKPGRTDKHTRIRSRIPLMRGGFYYINEVGCETFLKEKAEYPYGSTVDCLDAWAYDDCIQRPESPGEMESRFIEERRGHVARRWSPTGY